MKFTKHPGAACNGLGIGCFEGDGSPRRATRVAERLALEVEASLVGREE